MKSFIAVLVLTITIFTAITAFTGCARRYNASDIYNRGYAEYVSGNCTSAIGYFKWSLDLQKEYSDPMLGLARCYLEMARRNLTSGDPDAAMHDLEEALYWANLAINADPGNPLVTQIRVQVLNKRGETEEAIKAAQWGTQVQGATAQSLLLVAQTYIDAAAYDEAELALKQAIAVEPGYVQAHLQAGKFYERIGKTDQALFHFEEAYRLDPTNTDAQLKIAELSTQP
jgi:tetratricopeptide (TPR) repeat protein